MTEIGVSGRKQGWPASEIGFTGTDQSIFVTKPLCFEAEQCCFEAEQCCFRAGGASSLMQKDFSRQNKTVSMTE